MLRCYEPAHIVGVSKTAYVPATPRCLDWRRDPQRNQHEQRPVGVGFAGSSSPARSSSSPRSSEPSATSRWQSRLRRQRHPSPRRRPQRPPDDLRSEHRGASASPTAPSPTARRSSTTTSRGSPSSIQRSAVPSAGRRPRPRAPGSSSTSTAAGVPRRTRRDCSVRRSRSTARKRRPPAGWPPPRRLLTCRGTRSVGPSSAAAWLSVHGAPYGLCQIYRNEPWHYELRPEADPS